MAFYAVIHYPKSKDDTSKLTEDMITCKIVIMRDYLSKINTCVSNKIRIIEDLLKNNE